MIWLPIQTLHQGQLDQVLRIMSPGPFEALSTLFQAQTTITIVCRKSIKLCTHTASFMDSMAYQHSKKQIPDV